MVRDEENIVNNYYLFMPFSSEISHVQHRQARTTRGESLHREDDHTHGHGCGHISLWNAASQTLHSAPTQLRPSLQNLVEILH